jgi:hypothetical protein
MPSDMKIYADAIERLSKAAWVAAKAFDRLVVLVERLVEKAERSGKL